jgi:hypothetical protein
MHANTEPLAEDEMPVNVASGDKKSGEDNQYTAIPAVTGIR